MSSPDEDLDWLRALGGHAPTSPDSAASREAAWLRAVHLRQAAEPMVGPMLSEADVSALLQRARAEGLGRVATTPRRGWWSRVRQSITLHPGRAGLVLAAVVAGLVVVPAGLLIPIDEQDPGALRSAKGTVLVQSASPQADRDRLATELRTAGVEVHVYARLGRHGLDADLRPPVPQAVRKALAPYALPASALGPLRVEFAQKQ